VRVKVSSRVKIRVRIRAGVEVKVRVRVSVSVSYIMTIWRWEEISRCDKFPTTPVDWHWRLVRVSYYSGTRFLLHAPAIAAELNIFNFVPVTGVIKLASVSSL